MANRAWLGTIANGAVAANDIDYYAIDVPANTTLNLYAQVGYYGSPLWAKLTLFDRDGVRMLARQDSLVPAGDRGGRDAYLRHTLMEPGRYFVAISDSNGTGTANSWYSIKLFTLTPSPGDPVTTVRDGYQYVYWMRPGPGGLYVLRGSTIERVRLDGTASVFATAPYNSGRMAFDGLGNLLVTLCSTPGNGAIWRFSQDGIQSVFADSLPGRTSQVAVGPDGDVWVCFENKLLRFDPAGGLRDTVLTDYRIWYANDMAFAPNGDLLLASYDGVYRVHDSLESVIPEGHFLAALAFDRDGNMYAGQGSAFPGGVTLYDSQYHLLNDPVARIDSEARSLSIPALGFSRNDDGSMSRRLFALQITPATGAARIIELNPQGIRAPGASIAPPIGRVELDHLPDATDGQPYAAQLHATDGRAGTWTLSTGRIPAGLSFTASGELSGTAPYPGVYSFTVRRTSGSAIAYARVLFRVSAGASAATGLSVEVVTAALMGGPPLTAEQVQYLDGHGNHNGMLDIGDLRAYLRKP